MNATHVVFLRRVDSAYESSQDSGMSSNAQRLAEAVLARRAELDLTQLDVWQAGGPSNTTLTKVESGELEKLSRTTARKLDLGLQWAAGSARAIFDKGEEPLPTPPSIPGLHRSNERWLAEEIAAADLDPEVRSRILEILKERGAGA